MHERSRYMVELWGGTGVAPPAAGSEPRIPPPSRPLGGLGHPLFSVASPPKGVGCIWRGGLNLPHGLLESCGRMLAGV